jgi:outer membrane biosynthesis protein TonB
VTFALIESDRKIGSNLLGGSVPSLLVHALVIGGAVFATLSARERTSAVVADTSLVFLAPPPERQAPPPAPDLTMSLQGFQTVSVPAVIPTVIPPVALQEHFDPKDYTGTGVEGGRAAGLEVGADHVYEASAVDEQPQLLAAPPPAYPTLLREAGITGRVTLQAVIDTTGRADPATVKVLHSPNPGFEIPSRQWILKALFRPARLGGRLVRVIVNLPLDYSIAGRSGA